MPNRKELTQLIIAGSQGGNPYTERESNERLEKLKTYLEPKAAGEKQSALNKANLETLTNPALKGFLKPGGSVGVGDIKIGQEQKPLTIQLTPAQEAAEKEAGKKIAEFEGGGKAGAESNLAQIQGVQQELQQGQKDAYDRRVGGLLENHPTLMSVFAPKEKARRDAVQNAMLTMLHDAGIPRPTQWDIQRVFGQVYDAAADDKTNLARLQQAVSKLAGHSKAMESQADLYHKTGYATIGGQPAPKQAAPQQAAKPMFDPDAFLKGQ
jgi:hypothetical protein